MDYNRKGYKTCFRRSGHILLLLYSYNTGTRDMTEIYAQLPRAHSAQGEGECVYFSHIPSKRVITSMFHTLEVESIVSTIVKL